MDQQGPIVKAPILVVVIAWLMLIVGIIDVLFTLPALLLGALLGTITFLRGVGLIAISVGLRRMRRWALYLFTIINLLGIGMFLYALMGKSTTPLTHFADVLIEILILVYFWVISKDFV